MRPIWYLLIAEICFFLIAAINIAHGVAYFIDPANLNLLIVFSMFFVWYLDRYITYLFITHKVTAEDLLGTKP